MTLHVVKKLTSFIGSERLRTFHYDMYHGTFSRCGIVYPMQPDASIDNEIREPMEVVRIGRFIPDVFCPGRHFVVSEMLMAQLSRLQNIEFLRIRFRKLIDYPYAKGDFSFYDDPICDDSQDLFKVHQH